MYDQSDTLGQALREQGNFTLGSRLKISTPDKIEATPLLSDEMRTAIATGWRAAYALAFNNLDRKAPDFVANLAPHHRRAIKWHWMARHMICRALVIIGYTKRPRWFAYFPIFSRGHMKSTLARYIAIMDALISLYYGVPGYCLYFSGSNDKVIGHAKSIGMILKSHRMRTHAPLLSQVKRIDESERDDKGRSMGWKATFFYTAGNYIFHFSSLQSGLAGANFENIRITMMIPDDIDDRDDSPVQAESNLKRLTTEILPMGSSGTLTFWAQNLISRYSCMFRIYKGHKRVLTNRMKAIPIPAIRPETFRTDVATIDGTVRDIILPGAVPTWPQGMPIESCQEELNRIGLPSFEKECMHMVEQSTEGLMIHTYDDLIHPISLSEFESVYGTRRMPMAWPKEWGNDWARTKTAKHANVAMWRTVSSQNTAKPGFTFYFHPMSFKANAQPEDVAERVLSCLDPFVTALPGTRITPIAIKDQRRRKWAELRRDELIRANALEHTSSQLERIEFERAALQEIFPKYTEPLLLRHHVVGGVNSHEREDIRLIYNEVYGMQCQAANPGKFGGIEQLNRDFAVDRKLDHPFRPGIKGYSRTFVVCPDDTTKEPRIINGVKVYSPEPFPDELTPDDLHDDKLYRYQLMNWRSRESKITESGETIDEVLKMNDDFGNLHQFFATNGALLNEPLTVKEEFQMLMEKHIPKADPETGEFHMDKIKQQQFEAARVRAEQQLRDKHGDEYSLEPEDDESVYETEGFWS